MSTNSKGNKKVFTKPKDLFVLPPGMVRRSKTTYIHNSAWNFTNTIENSNISVDPILNKEIDSSIAYLTKVVKNYVKKEDELLKKVNENNAKNGNIPPMTKGAFLKAMTALIKNDIGMKTLHQYKFDMHGKGGAASNAKKNSSPANRGAANKVILQRMLDWYDEVQKLDVMHLDSKNYMQNLEKHMEGTKHFQTMDLSTEENSAAFFKHMLSAGKDVGHLAEENVYKMFFGAGYTVEKGQATRGYDIFITDQKFGVEVKTNVNDILKKYVTSNVPLEDILRTANPSDAGKALYVIGNMLQNGLKIRTGKSSVTYIAYKLRLAVHLMELVRALEGGGFDTKGGNNADVTGVMIITPNGMTYASLVFGKLLNVLKSRNLKQMTRNIVSTQKFFQNNSVKKINKKDMASRKKNIRDKMSSDDRDDNTLVYEKMNKGMKKEFGAMNSDLRKLKLKLKFHLRM